ncbi:hypothetical protein D3C74_346780 [compost metagenome]
MDRRGDRRGTLDRGLGLGPAGERGEDLDRRDGTGRLGRAGRACRVPVARERVRPEERALGDRRDLGLVGRGQRDRDGRCPGQLADGRAGRATQGLGRERARAVPGTEAGQDEHARLEVGARGHRADLVARARDAQRRSEGLELGDDVAGEVVPHDGHAV